MMKIKAVKKQHNDIPYNYFDKESDKVCFMFSGKGYSYEKPLLYYSTELMLELGYDVVQVCYTFDSKQFEQEPEAISEMVYNGANPIVEYILSTKSYTEAVFIGKSIGTLPITDFYMQQASSIPSRYALLTPLLSLDHVMGNLLGKHAFLAIGTADPHYSKERLDQLSSHELAIVVNADHSLEITNHTVESVILYQSLLTALKAYLH